MFVFCTTVQTQDMLGYQYDGLVNEVRIQSESEMSSSST